MLKIWFFLLSFSYPSYGFIKSFYKMSAVYLILGKILFSLINFFNKIKYKKKIYNFFTLLVLGKNEQDYISLRASSSCFYSCLRFLSIMGSKVYNLSKIYFSPYFEMTDHSLTFWLIEISGLKVHCSYCLFSFSSCLFLTI